MKLLYLFVLFVLFSIHSSFAQNINIPDPHFKQALLNHNPAIDTNKDNQISEAEAKAVTSLNVNSKNISNLSGIEHFTNLEELHCGFNSLTSLDVRGLNSLRVLYCGYNSLTSLDMSGLVNLQYLDCDSNSLTSLDVGGLNSLWYLRCGYNSLTSLDVSGLDSLQILSCFGNSLTSLDVSGLSSLETLDCGINSLTSLDVSGLDSLQILYCDSNSLTSLDVSGLGNLQYLECDNNSLISVDLRNTPNLSELYADGNPDLQCLIVDDPNDPPLVVVVDQNPIPYTTEPCLATNTSHNSTHTVQNVYPNPTSGRVNFSQPDQRVVVYDMLGKVIKKAEGVDHIDMTGYQPGVYVIQLSKDNERSVHRVVKR